MSLELHIDFETRSEVEISGQSGVGLHNYAIHPSTRVLMLAWAVNTDEPELWEPHVCPMPDRLCELLTNPDVVLVAFNSAFERYILKHQLNIDIPAERFRDPQASARYLSLPANLEDVGMVLGLPMELRKDKHGAELLELFSFPKKRLKKELKANPSLSPTYFYDWNTHPKEWTELGEYAKQDVRAEREVARREALLGTYPLPAREHAIWLFDQKVNDRGMPIDVDFVKKALEIAQKDKDDQLEKQNKITGLLNANSAVKLLPWLQERGYPLENLRKNNIEIILKDPERGKNLTDEARTVLKARITAASTSYTKLKAILRNVSPDGRIRNMFIYMGSARCGRWSGSSVQPHNFARPDGTFEDMTNVVKARNMIYAGDYKGLKEAFPKHTPLTVVKNLIRTVFVAP